MRTMFSLLQRREIGTDSPARFLDAAKVHKHFVQRLKLDRKLEVHRGCVNTICWNETGCTILSGSDDQNLVISDPYSGKVHTTIRSGHRSNIFGARFLPNCDDSEIVSCSGAGSIYYTQVEREDMYGKCLFDCHVGTTYEIVTVPNEPRTFLSCGEDGTVRWFDLRIKTSCNKERCKDDVLINCRSAVTSVAVDPVLPYQLATACAYDGSVRIYDRRMLATRLSGTYSSRAMAGLVCRFVAPLEHKTYRITSLNYSSWGHDILASYSAENVYLFNTQIEEGKVFSKAEDEDEGINGTQSGGACGSDPTTQPPTKRLRLRGDWSDTGPNARPERERTEEGGQPQVNLMQRMSDMLTRWLDGSLRRRDDGPQEGGAVAREGDEAEPNQQEADNPDQQGVLSEEGRASGAGNSDQGTESRRAGENPSGGQRSDVEGQCDSDQDRRGTEASPDERGTMEETAVDEEAGSEKDKHDCHCWQDVELDSPVCDGAVDASEDFMFVQNKEGTSQMSPHLPSGSTVVGVGRDEQCQGKISGDTTLDTIECEVDKPVLSASGQSPWSPRDPEADMPTWSSSVDSMEHFGQVASSHAEDVSTTRETAACIQQCGSRVDTDNSHVVEEKCSSPIGSGSDAKLREVRDSNSSGVTCPTDASAGVMVTQGTMVPTSRLEPVISLHYSDQGTTASTIQVAYASFDVLDSPNNQCSVPTSAASVCPTSDGVAVDSGSGSKAEALQPVSPAPCLAERVMPESDITLRASGSTSKHQSSSLGVSVSTDITSPSQLEKVGSDAGQLTEGFVADSQERKEGESEVACCANFLSADQTGQKADENTTAHDTDSCYGAGTLGQQDSQPSTSTVDREAAAESDGQASSSGSRHRRMGHSEPPTGNFQLVLDEDDSVDSDDEGNAAAASLHMFHRYGPSGGESDRHYAATCMQSVFRKRMEEREKREMAAVFQPQAERMYTGHRNSRTMIKEANFWGDSIVMSGSDCGRIFLWDRDTTQLLMLLEADRHVVNCLQPHPFDPILASSGIDYDVKIWVPLEPEPCFDSEMAEMVMRRNQIMLEETRDTITVPAAFMLRVLASLNQIRAGRAGAGRQQESPGDSD